MTLCERFDPDLWFPHAGDGAAAIAICHQCPTMASCRQHALDNRIEYGIWGGLTEKDRRELLTPRTRRKGRAPRGPRPRRDTPCPEAPSEIRGVSWNSSKGRWVVAILHGGRRHWFGTHETRAQAETVAIEACRSFGLDKYRSPTWKKKAA